MRIIDRLYFYLNDSNFLWGFPLKRHYTLWKDQLIVACTKVQACIILHHMNGISMFRKTFYSLAHRNDKHNPIWWNTKWHEFYHADKYWPQYFPDNVCESQWQRKKKPWVSAWHRNTCFLNFFLSLIFDFSWKNVAFH